MSEQTPERLKQFRESYPQSSPARNRLMSLCFGMMVFCLVSNVLLFMKVSSPHSGTASNTDAVNAKVVGGLTEAQQRSLAALLAEKKETAAAIAEYDAYLKRATLPEKERATVCYAVAKVAIEGEKYEAALPYLYQAEYLDPKSDLHDEINKKVVLCLDKLGRNVDLRHELRQRTDVKRTAADIKPGEVVLAEFAGEIITDRDLENEIEKLPPSARGQFDSPDKKSEFLRNLVAERLLRDKARRLELDKSPEIQDQLLKQLDGLMVQKLVADEVKNSVQVTPEDVERFYKAEPERFTDPATAEVLVAKAETEETAKGITDFAGNPVTVQKGSSVPGQPGDLKVPDGVITAVPDTLSAPVKAGNAWYVFKTVKTTPEKQHPFEEVKERATRMLQFQKQQEKVSALLDETLQARDVKLYPDRLKESKPTP